MSRQVDIKALVSHLVKGDGKDRCRICMGDTSEGQVFLGDTVMMDGDKPVTLAELLEVITGVEVTQDTELPDSLCSLCYMSAHSFAEFRMLCCQSTNQWDSILDFLSHIPHYQYSTNTYKITTILNDDSFTIHEEKVPTIKEKKFMKHIKEKFRDTYAKSIQCQCPNCGKPFIYAQHLAKHLKESTDYQRACHLCAEIMSKEDLVKHLIQTHGKKPYDCKKCLAIFRSKKQYAEHLSKAHTPGSCTCGDCGRSFQSSQAFHAHMSVHASKNCPNCNKLFRNQTCYLYHVKRCCNLDKNREDTHITKHKVMVLVDGPKKTVKVGMRGSADSECICDYCHKKFAGRKFVAAHIQIVHLKNTHRPCSYCGKLLAAAHMPTHLKKHEQVYVYKCDQCGMILKSKLGYQQHLRLHSGEKPYSCQYCYETFSASSRRSEHVRKVHKKEEDLRHACEICPAKFRIPCKLKKHMETAHSKVAKYSCNMCNNKFLSCRALLIHTRNEHRSIREETLCPNSACATCACAALAAQEFRLSVRNSHKMWLRTLNCISEIPSNSSSCKSICAFLNVEEMTIQTLKDYIGGEPKAILDRLQRSKSKRKPRSDRSGPPCDCPDCGKRFLTPYYLNMHLINSGQKEACLICGVVVLRGEAMRDHMVSVHKETAELCTQCPVVCKDQNELQTHITKAHKGHSLTCTDCGRTFSRRKTFEFHNQMHAVRTCRACGIQFTNRGCYRVHRSNCEPDAMPDTKRVPLNRRSNIRDPAIFHCADCDKTYSSKPQLKNHILWIHMNIRPHQCQWCEKRFYTPSRLAEHTVVHTRARNFECDLCGAKLVSKMAAVYHRRRHTGEKPYECPDCGESFISASRRSEHAKRRHNKGIKIQCMYCPSTFVRKHEMKRHVAKAHGLEVSICSNRIVLQQ